ncbi:hypothetical protein L1049_007616 [Liquidambar formosana]|uniref:BRCT domain-containing protein n=1 Tax=Liquidambar formosana TaxID=63359 RepID=A0AAP0S1Q9_LIQFO
MERGWAGEGSAWSSEPKSVFIKPDPETELVNSSPPWEVLVLVAHHLDPKTLAIASCVCKSWLNCMSSDQHWNSVCSTHYPSLFNLKLTHPAVPYRRLYALGHTASKRRLQNPSKPHISLENLVFAIDIQNHDSHIATISIPGEDLVCSQNELFQFDINVGQERSTAIAVLEGVKVTWNIVLKGWRGVFCVMDCEGKASFVNGTEGWFSVELPPPGCCSSEIASGLLADLRLGFRSGCESGGMLRLENVGVGLLSVEVLNIYMKELPTMNYAANTGKQSMFLERCLSNGKYCTLLLKSKSVKGFEEVIAAVTYQIIPADTQYAEIPIAAVSSIYQRKGLGSLLYMELRKRLKSVGIRTIFCWGDKESEGFWFKQGFVSIAEVDTKGRARRLPIKADIRRALCFPGGSTLMVSHLNNDISANHADPQKLCFSSKPLMKSLSYAETKSQGQGESYNIPKALNKMISRTENSLHEVVVKDAFSIDDNKLDGSSHGGDSVRGCRDLVPFEGVDWNNMTTVVGITSTGADADVKHCSCSTHGVKRRVWEASVSSLKSKKVKGCHLIDCQLDSDWDFVPESDGRNDSCFDECSLGTSRNKSLVEVTPRDYLTSTDIEKNVEECRPVTTMLKDQISEEPVSKGDCFRIMLMNIADDTKKTHLTKIIEDLGGAVTSDGSVSTHVITGKVRKTLNFCTALCSGAWILSSSWLKESFREGRFVDELPFILKDEDYALKYRSELKGAVLRSIASPRVLLKGYDVCLAAHVQPPARTLSAIVRSAGGNVIYRLNKVQEASKTIFVACEEDMEEALLAAKKGIWTFSSDWL